MRKINLKDLSLKEIEDYLESIGEKKYRGRQIFDWLYKKEVETFNEMTTLSRSLRQKLNNTATIKSIYPLIFQESIIDKTTKFLFQLNDGKKIESVLIPPKTTFLSTTSKNEDEQKRLTICVSTQVGCPLGCIFCGTATMGFHRNLTSGEIIDQYIQVKKITGKKITNIVFMGMGEPLLNYKNVMNTIEIISQAIGIASKRITLSTAGIVAGIKRLGDENRKIKLSISLHSLNNHIRSELMPLNKIFNLQQLLEAIQYYYQKTKLRVTFEYILFSGINDTADDIKALVNLARKIPCKINLIPFHKIDFLNPQEKSKNLIPVDLEKAEKFAQSLRKNHLTVFIRSSAGEDISAACGQLAVRIDN